MALGIDGRWHVLRAEGRAAWCMAAVTGPVFDRRLAELTDDEVRCSACPRERDIAVGREPTAPVVVVEVSELGGS